MLFLQIEYFTTPEFIRPSTSFIGQITRIISDKFLSIDQLGMGYVEFTPKAKFQIQKNLKYIWDTNKKTSPEIDPILNPVLTPTLRTVGNSIILE